MNWTELLENHNIPYVTRGPNTRRGEVSVRCPFCGEDDPSEHMGIVLEREAWGCHRNPQHRGKSPAKLIQALLGCPMTQARLAVAQYGAADPDSLGLEKPTSDAPRPVEPLFMPPEFKPVTSDGTGRRFFWYLTYRGFDKPLEAVQRYDLKYCTTGRWKDRLIIPIYKDGELAAWTGRALQNPVNAPRYLSTSEAIKQTIFNEDKLTGGEVLFITEGPFDAMKVDFYGRWRGAMATATFGTSITPWQVASLRAAQKRFQKTILLFDADAIGVTFDMAEWLPGAEIGFLPERVKDPGAMTKKQVNDLIDCVGS